VNTQLVATQQQLQQLQERYNELESGHVILLQQVVQLQKIVKNHDGAMHRVMGFLHMVDAQRRNSRTGSFANGQIGIADLVGNGPDDHPASPLQQASQLLGEFSTDALFNKDLEQLQAGFTYRSEFSTPSNDQVSAGAAPTSAGGPRSNHHIGYSHVHYDVDSMVYPVGQTNGINPINSEHIHNIPYSLPPSTTVPSDAQMDMSQGTLGRADRKKSVIETVWGHHKPRILLVEDDKTCARIGSKFLQTFECGVETAVCMRCIFETFC
jgi:osomolarity two-component system response regulator SKN7